VFKLGIGNHLGYARSDKVTGLERSNVKVNVRVQQYTWVRTLECLLVTVVIIFLVMARTVLAYFYNNIINVFGFNFFRYRLVRYVRAVD